MLENFLLQLYVPLTHWGKRGKESGTMESSKIVSIKPMRFLFALLLSRGYLNIGGVRSEIRTLDLLIKNQLLFHLS